MNLWQMSCYGAVMIFIIAVLRKLFLNRLPKTTFLVLWALVLIRLLIPFRIPSGFSVYSVLPEVVRSIGEEADSITECLQKARDGQKQTNRSDTVQTETAAPMNTVQTEAAAHKETALTEEATLVETGRQQVFGTGSRERRALLFSLWLAGVCICGVSFLHSYQKCRKEFQTALPFTEEFTDSFLALHPLKRKVTIRILDTVDTPLTYGIFRPVILLPKGGVQEKQDAQAFILEHEFVHIKRWDAVTKLLINITLCIHWFNPFVWLMSYLFNRDLELSCDEAVLQRLGETRRASYAKTLIGMEEKRSGLLSFYSSFGRNAMEERIVAMMKIKKKTVAAGISAAVVVGAVAVCFITCAKEKEPEETTVLAQSEEGKNAPEEVETLSYEELLKEYEKYGVTESGQEGKEYMEYFGEPIRYFLDGYDKYDGTISRFTYLNGEGTVDVHTVREDKQNADGSTELFGPIVDIVPYSEEEFAERDITVINPDSEFLTAETVKTETGQPEVSVLWEAEAEQSEAGKAEVGQPEAVLSEGTVEETAVANGMNLSGFGKTFEEIFAPFEKYGITYEKTGNGVGNVFLNGEPVACFIDENAEKTFTFSSQDKEGITVYVAYEKRTGPQAIKGIVKDTDGLITRLSAGEIPLEEKMAVIRSFEDSMLVFETGNWLCTYSCEQGKLVSVTGKQEDRETEELPFYPIEDYVNPDYTVCRSANCIVLENGQVYYLECSSGILHDMCVVIENSEGERVTEDIFPDLTVE